LPRADRPHGPLFGAALIVKDEEDVLGRCLGSIRPVVDEIVVVDTGSTDASISIAESFGACVLRWEWGGDFSEARNCALDNLQSQWVLYIDADEYLAPVSRAEVERWLTDPTPHVAYRLWLRSRVGYTPYREHRVWRNRPDIRFWGVIHESHLAAINAVARDEGLLIGDIELLLEHDGYEGDQGAKHDRNLPLLLAQVELDPERSYLWDHIGRIHSALGRPSEARSAWEQGRQVILRHGDTAPADAAIYIDLINANAIEGRPDAGLVEEADTLFPDNVAVLWSGALDAEARCAFDQVVERLDRLSVVGRDTAARDGLGVDERIFGEWLFHLRGVALYKLGDRVGAARDFAAAEACDPANVEYRVKRQLAWPRSEHSGH